MSNRYRKNLLVCNGISCQQASDLALVAFINSKLKEYQLENEIKVIQSVCSNKCSIGPNIIVYPDNVEYSKVTKADIDDIIIEHLLNDRIVERLVFDKEKGNGVAPKKQYRIALRNCGFIDPEEIKDYIEKDGYNALAKCLTEYSPQEVTQEIIKSGLRGRGGGGFPTGLKWEITSKSVANQKYVVCNADEGDPGAFMDRSVLEGDPHSVLEAMAICGYCIGSNKGIIYVRAEYPLAIKRIENAIWKCHKMNLLGKITFN